MSQASVHVQKVRFHPAARLEYVEALVYLEDCRGGYGEMFEGEVFLTLEQVRQFPESGARLPTCLELPVRKFSLRRFRYDIIAGCHDGTIVVYAIAHRARKPSYWRDRLAFQ